MATYLVTGAAGFIAARVCEMLLAEGHTVVGIDNLNDYYDVRLKDYRLSKLLGAASRELGADPKVSVYADLASSSKLQALRSGNFSFHVLDIEHLDQLDRLFAEWKFDAVFNLAARAGVRASLEHPELYHRTNVVGEENVLKCQVKHGVRKHVLASSSSVYAGCPMPFREDMELGKMHSPYAETKLQAELLAKDYHEKHGLDVTVLRYFTVYGPAGRPDMAPFRFVHWIATGQPIRLNGDGNQTRDFTYIDDIARGTVAAARLPGGQLTVDSSQATSSQSLARGSKLAAPRYEVINLGGGNRPITINQLIGILESLLHREAIIDHQPANQLDMVDTHADVTKAERLLGWIPQISPQEGFERVVNSFENISWIRKVQIEWRADAPPQRSK
ncbi:MAG TPA: NAD-dependent epimerase/dehydratase family protein [Lacunisphaera sp.]|nr:NAD-dependent epimerase/dehydratase family protein [Lacunisphaera sp.]